MRRMLERISPVLFVSVVAGGFVVTSALPATAAGTDERRDRLHAKRPVAAATLTPVATQPDLVAQIEQAEAEERAAAEAWFAGIAQYEWFAGIARYEAEQQARSASVQSSQSSQGATSSPRSGSCNGDVDCFLECTRAHESDTSGGYGAVSSSGTYRGAYQFSQRTWDAAAAGAGYEEFAGQPADAVPAEVQDAAAAHLYSVSGTAPWGGRC